jgi:hypothetical protein
MMTNTEPTTTPTPSKLTKLHRIILRKLAEFPADQWLDDKKLADSRTIEQLIVLAMVERDPASPAYRLTVAGREIADKYGESKFVRRQRHTIERVATYWADLFEIEELRPAFRLALTRILSRELRLTPDAPVPACICSTELMHNTFPHYCPAAPTRSIAVVAHNPDDVLLEAINKIGVACTGSARDLLPANMEMSISRDVITVWSGNNPGEILVDQAAVRADCENDGGCTASG